MRTYVVGAGAIGMPLAAMLTRAGHRVTAVRTSSQTYTGDSKRVTVELGEESSFEEHVEMISLSHLEAADDGVVVVTAKATANANIAGKLKHLFAEFPLVLLQNGIGVEKPFLESGYEKLYRCVLYATGNRQGESRYRFRQVIEW